MIKHLRLTKNQAALIRDCAEVQKQSFINISQNQDLLEDFIHQNDRLQGGITLSDVADEIQENVSILNGVIEKPRRVFSLNNDLLSGIKHTLNTIYDSDESGFSKRTRASVWRLLLMNDTLKKQTN